MKIILFTRYSLLAFAICFAVAELRAQTYSLDWFTLDGGGGTSTGGVYAVSGTIGQPDAAWPVDQNGFAVLATGGTYTLAGGFWGIVAAVQTPGAPRLNILLINATTVAVSWPSSATGFVLQQNTDSAASAKWSSVLGMIQDDGTTKTFIIYPPIGNRFYRLKK